MNGTWAISPFSAPKLKWGAVRAGSIHACSYCGTLLLTGEVAGFCCGPKGKFAAAVPPLPPFPPEFNVFLEDRTISSHSRVLNMLFSFASLQTTHEFPTFSGGTPAFVAIKGRVYHQVRPKHQNSAVRWLLHDGFLQDGVPHSEWAARLPSAWIEAVQVALLRVNPMVASLRYMGQLPAGLCSTVSLSLLDTGASPEIAAVMNYESTSRNQASARNLIVLRKDVDDAIHIPTTSKLWEPLAYPLLFPHGTLGWGLGAAYGVSDDHLLANNGGDVDTMTTQMWHYRRRLLQEPRFRQLGRLANEYLVDMFSRDLECRLNYIRQNQQRLRDSEAELMGETSVSETENIYLPASFLGSQKWARNQIADSLAIAATYGPPTFFITATCNPDWPEIKSQLRPGQNYSDIPEVVCRVFKRKVSWLLQTLRKMFPNSGGVVYIIHSIEFQKRGLPHVHILVKYRKDCLSAEDIDSLVTAELPDDPADKALVLKFMEHRHSESYCMRTNKSGERYCRFSYPHAVSEHTCIQTDGRVLYRRRSADDVNIVPHCLALLRGFQGHLNWEVANSSHLFQYLFKYIHKGPDMTKYRLHHGSDQTDEPIDEIEDYWKGRYLVATEAAWRILGFHVSHKDPSCTELPIHLPNSHHFHQYHRKHGQSSTLSLLDRYFGRPLTSYEVVDAVTGSVTQHSFASLTFTEYFRLFRLEKFKLEHVGKPGCYFEQTNSNGSPPQTVILRSGPHVARLMSVPPSKGELFYLRALLVHRACSSFIDARTVDGVVHGTFQEAASAVGLFADEREAEYSIAEAINALRTPRQLRVLFIHLLVNDCVPAPLALWNRFRDQFVYDFFINNGNSEMLAVEFALQELGQYLEEYGRDLNEFGLPSPQSFSKEVEHELSRWSPHAETLLVEAHAEISIFLEEQRYIFDVVLHAVREQQPLLLFIDGKAGRGKTTLIRALCNYLRAHHRIVLATATSAFAAQQYPGGRTTHSTFKVPVNENNEFLVSPIQPNHPRADLIKSTACVVWDEAPMANQAVLSCVDDTCRRIMGVDTPFGGKVLVLLGDFRQTCPVIPRGSRVRVVHASIRSSPLWHNFGVLRLTRPIRNAEDPDFANFVDSIGDGAGPEVALPFLGRVDTEADLCDFVFPEDVLPDPARCLKRAILAPTNNQVDAYNEHILSKLPGQQRVYLAADSLKEVEEVGLFPPDGVLDWASRSRLPGFPAHALTVKVGGVYRLLRNLSIDRGLVKNVRLVVMDVGHRLVTTRLLKDIGGASCIDSEDILIPRISFSMTLPSKHTLLRRQFPLAPAYATTFNSCQGLTLDVIGIDLTRPVFSHGQLYTALSRVRHRSHARVRLRAESMTVTNVTYHEILL